MDKKTHFGFKTINETEKSSEVANVFHSVADKYDIMNDIMSVGLHRIWKKFTISSVSLRSDAKILDIAGGTGDLAKAWYKKIGEKGEVWLTDINNSMLKIGRDRLLDGGIIAPVVQCDAEKLPFPDNYFDLVSVSFGLRNMTHKDIALKEMYRVLNKGGILLILEFSKVYKALAPIYDFYSFKLLPFFGKIITQDKDSYQYLAESIRMHPDQEKLQTLMEDVGYSNVTYNNLSGGIVALHKGFKIN